MTDISFVVPAEIRFGLDVCNRLTSLIAGYGERVLLVTEAILYEGKIIDRLQGLLDKQGIRYITFDEVIPNATSTVVDAAVKLARGAQAEVVVGLGGIRTLSTAKAAAMISPTTHEVDDFLSGTRPREAPLPYIALPTTCRDPFLLLDECLITDARDRRARIIRTQKGITRGVLVDPKLTLTLPVKYTATTLLDTLLNAVEGYLSARSNILSDTFFTKAMEQMGRSLPQMIEQPEDLKVRADASLAGLLTSLGLTVSKPGMGTALSYAINSRFMVPKSWVAAILLPHVLEFNIPTSLEKLVHIAGLLGEDVAELDASQGAARGIEAVRRWLGSLGLPGRLRDFDLELDDMVDIAEIAHSFDMINHLPRPVATDDLYQLIKSSF